MHHRATVISDILEINSDSLLRSEFLIAQEVRTVLKLLVVVVVEEVVVVLALALHRPPIGEPLLHRRSGFDLDAHHLLDRALALKDRE